MYIISLLNFVYQIKIDVTHHPSVMVHESVIFTFKKDLHGQPAKKKVAKKEKKIGQDQEVNRLSLTVTSFINSSCPL